MSHFLNSNHIIEFEIKKNNKKINLSENILRSLKHLKIEQDKFIDLKLFKSL